MVSTAAENVAGGSGEQLALWNAVTRDLAARRSDGPAPAP